MVLHLFMTLLILVAMSYRVTGNIAHEINGVAIIALFIAHNIVNRRWYLSLFRGKYNFHKFLRAAVNLLIAAALLVLVVSAVLLSRTLFPSIDSGASMFPKRIHSFAAYWLFILVSVHIGLHWGVFLSRFKLRINRICVVIMRITAFVLAIYGVYVSFSRDVGARLIMYYSFDFWDPNKPAIGFLLSNAAIMGLYVFLAYYVLKFIYRRNKS